MSAPPTPMPYDTIGNGYGRTRKADPRIANLIEAALGTSASLLNVGAGTGAYEPRDRLVVAVEPSRLMLASRPAGSAPAICGRAEMLPLADRSVDAALAVLTVHHWTDQRAGLRECARVARDRVVLFTWDPESDGFWLTRDYLPATLSADRARFPTMAAIRAAFWPDADLAITSVLVPWDCEDGFLGAFWRRPAAYLNPDICSGMSALARPDDITSNALARLARDIESGAWQARYKALLNVAALDIGYRLVTARLG